MQSKFKLRQTFKSIRKNIAETYRHEAAMKAAELFAAHPLFKQSQHIACYLSLPDEFDSLPLIETIWQNKKECYLPVIAKKNDKQLLFIHYRYGDALHLNQYSILEPKNMSKEISPQELDLVIMPLIAFDREGHRLGTGGGYYDRTFAFMHEEKKAKPILTGLAYAAQQTETLPHDDWDVHLAEVITEREVIVFSSEEFLPPSEEG